MDIDIFKKVFPLTFLWVIFPPQDSFLHISTRPTPDSNKLSASWVKHSFLSFLHPPPLKTQIEFNALCIYWWSLKHLIFRPKDEKNNRELDTALAFWRLDSQIIILNDLRKILLFAFRSYIIDIWWLLPVAYS